MAGLRLPLLTDFGNAKPLALAEDASARRNALAAWRRCRTRPPRGKLPAACSHQARRPGNRNRAPKGLIGCPCLLSSSGVSVPRARLFLKKIVLRIAFGM